MLFFVLLQFFFNLIVVIVFVLFWGNQVRTAKCILSCRPTATLPIPLPLDSTADHVPWPRDPNSISGFLAAFTRLGWCPGCGVPPTQAMPCVPCGPATLLGGDTVPTKKTQTLRGRNFLECEWTGQFFLQPVPASRQPFFCLFPALDPS